MREHTKPEWKYGNIYIILEYERTSYALYHGRSYYKGKKIDKFDFQNFIG